MHSEHVFDHIIADLTDMIYNVHPPDFIADPFEGTFTSTDIWFRSYGAEEQDLVRAIAGDDRVPNDSYGIELIDIPEDDVLTLPTFSMSDDDFEMEGEEAITAEEEEEMCIGARILIDLSHLDSSDSE